MKRLFVMLGGLLSLLVPAMSLAQPAPLIIDQSRADRSPPVAAAQPAAPTGSGKVEAAPAPSVSFVLKGARVQGSSLPPSMLQAAWAPYVGRTVTAADLGKIADALGAVYAGSDVALYTIQLRNQSFAGGQARFDVIEGFVAEVAVSAEPERPAPGLVRAYARRLMGETPLRRSTLERYAALMRDVPGAKIDIQLLQANKPGAVKVAVKVTRRRVEATFAVNNRGSSVLGRTQIEASASANSVFRDGDRTTLVVAAPTEIKQFQYVGLTETQPLGDRGAMLNVSAGYLRTAPRFNGVEIDGTAATAGVQVSYPLIRSNTKNLYLTGGVDGVNSDNAVFGETLSSSRTRALRLAAAWSDQDAKQAVTASATLSHGLDVLGARTSGPGSGELDFTKLNGQATLAHQFGRWTVRLAASAQIAANATPATEAFALGGAQFGRGFASAVLTGQSGVAASAELAWRPPIQAARLKGLELYGFVDGGHVANPFAPLLPRNADLSSGGGGVRVPVGGKTIAEFEIAKPISAPDGLSSATRLSINLRSQF